MKRWVVLVGFLINFDNVLAFEDSTKIETIYTQRWYEPTHFATQFAGNIGWLSGGLGFSSARQNYHLAFIYGYVPERFGGIVSHLVTAKNTFHLHRFFLNQEHTIIPYLSIGVSVELGGRSFFTLPESMPNEYYALPKSLHLIPGAGVKMRYESSHVRPFHALEFFAEASSYDVLIFYRIYSKEVPMNNVVSLALGINFVFQK